jgi:hypothetical protein
VACLFVSWSCVVIKWLMGKNLLLESTALGFDSYYYSSIGGVSLSNTVLLHPDGQQSSISSLTALLALDFSG